jgi:DNA-binding NarL/FixJ family response regulator
MDNGDRRGKRRRRVVLVDDHPIVRSGLAQLINREPDLLVCGEAASSTEAIAAIQALDPDLVLLDISIKGSNGIEVVKTLGDSHPDLPVLMLSMHDEKLYAERAVGAGARGYVMKQEAPGTILTAIRSVLQGRIYVSDSMTTNIIRNLVLAGTNADQTGHGIKKLSDRELEIYELIGSGMTTREIADRLNISVKTVETHRVHIRHKLKLRSAAELTHRAIRWVESQNNLLQATL